MKNKLWLVICLTFLLVICGGCSSVETQDEESIETSVPDIESKFKYPVGWIYHMSLDGDSLHIDNDGSPSAPPFDMTYTISPDCKWIIEDADGEQQEVSDGSIIVDMVKEEHVERIERKGNWYENKLECIGYTTGEESATIVEVKIFPDDGDPKSWRHY